MSRPFGRCLTLSVALALVCLNLGHPILAHPHVRISVEVTFVVENGAMQAVKHRWTFDESFRRSNFDEFDVNQNGILEEGELSAFRELSLETLKRFDSFTVVWQGAAKIKLREPVMARCDMQAPKPVYEFEVALSTPVPLTDTGASIEVYDPTYFSAFDFHSAHAVFVESKGGADCSAALVSPQRYSAQMKDYRAFASAFGPLAAKLVTPRSIKVTCQSTEFP